MAETTLSWAGCEMLFRQNVHLGFADRDVRNPSVVRMLGVQRQPLGRVHMTAPDDVRFLPDPGQDAAFAEVAGLARARGMFSGR